MSNIVVPQLGESVVEARVARWLKKEGDAVAAGEPIVELETEKIDLEVGAEQAGVLSKIAHQEGDDVKVGEVLGVIEVGAQAVDGASAAHPATRPPADPPSQSPSRPVAESPSEAAQSPSHPVAQSSSQAAQPSSESAQSPSRPVAESPSSARATPTARRVAETHDIQLAGVAGTGDAGRITKRDVEGRLGQARDAGPVAAPPPATSATPPPPTPSVPAATPAPSGPPPTTGPTAPPSAPAPARRRAPDERLDERVRMSKRRLTIARNLVEAQRTAAMLTTFNEADMSAVMALRERRKQAFKERYGVSLGIASFFVKACVSALQAFPRLNAEIQGEEMVLKRYYDIGIAVGAPQGLVVPVLRDADLMSFAEVEQGIRQFAAKAQDGTLTLEDLRGGTFTITNGGVFGSLLSTPILNPPQVGILGLHKIEDRPIVQGGQIVVRPMMYLALSYDHRIVDGLEAVQFLVRIKELIEDPGQMLLEG